MSGVAEAQRAFIAQPKAQAQFNLADAKARFSEVIARVEKGEAIEIVRRGKLVARIVPVQEKRRLNESDFQRLRELRESMPFQEVSSVDLLRELREDRF